MSIEMINDSLQKEIQISIDPASMKEIVKYTSLGLPQPRTSTKRMHSIPRKNKFLSTSLPSSACSSPRQLFPKSKVEDHGQGFEKGSPDSSSLTHYQSVALSRLIWLRENRMQRSKSCGDGRPSGAYDEFDLCQNTNKTSTVSSASTASSMTRGQTTSDDQYRRFVDSKKRNEDDFKCGALCLFLPGFGKGKPMRGKRDEREHTGHVISQRVSLEKFECGSWTSSTFLNDGGKGSEFSSNRYYDLPLELIRTNANDATLPVNSAFVFDKDVKGVLKTKGGGERKSNDCRHVRFSTSSASTSPSTCITPRMRKAREEFNSFLAAQNA